MGDWIEVGQSLALHLGVEPETLMNWFVGTASALGLLVGGKLSWWTSRKSFGVACNVARWAFTTTLSRLEESVLEALSGDQVYYSRTQNKATRSGVTVGRDDNGPVVWVGSTKVNHLLRASVLKKAIASYEAAKERSDRLTRENEERTLVKEIEANLHGPRADFGMTVNTHSL